MADRAGESPPPWNAEDRAKQATARWNDTIRGQRVSEKRKQLATRLGLTAADDTEADATDGTGDDGPVAA